MAGPKKYKNRNSHIEIVNEAYICCENYEFLWDKKDISRFKEMWNDGLSIFEIAEDFNRKPREVLFLVIDQYDIKIIKRRPGGIWGKENEPNII